MSLKKKYVFALQRGQGLTPTEHKMKRPEI